MMAKCADQPDREESPRSDTFLKFILLVQVAALALIGVDWLAQQFGSSPLTIGTHTIVVAGAFYSARWVWRYHKQTVIPGLVDLTLRMGRQPDVIGPYNVFAYLASAWLLVAIGYGIDTARLLGWINFHIVALLMS